MKVPKLRHQNRTDRGWYEPWGGGSLLLGKAPLVIVVCHELAHHWVRTKLTDVDGDHRFDFTLRLDKLAEEAAAHLDIART